MTPSSPSRRRSTSEWRADRTSSLQVMTPNRAEVVEDAYPKRDYRGDRKVHAQLVAEVGQAARERHVREQPAEEHARLECAGDVRLERTEDRVEGRQQSDRRVARISDRDRYRRQQA